MSKQKEEAEKRDRAAILLEERKKAIYNLVLLGTAAFVVLIGILTMAWFANNTKVNGTNMSVRVQSDLFRIEPLDNPAHEGIYDDVAETDYYVRNRLLNRINKEDDILIWTITDDSLDTTNEVSVLNKGLNIGNGIPVEGHEPGIAPGSYGELKFRIIPYQDVTVNFKFKLYAYSIQYTDEGEENKETIAYINSSSDQEKRVANNLLNGHLLLFANKDAAGKYSGLIQSSDDLLRCMDARAFTQNESGYEVSVFWVWPETLAEIVLDETEPTQKVNMHGRKNICADEDRTNLLNYMVNHPEYFLYDPEGTKNWNEIEALADASSEDPSESQSGDQNVEQDPEPDDEEIASQLVALINSSYPLYSSYYNEADQCIGMHVAYLLLEMAASDAATE